MPDIFFPLATHRLSKLFGYLFILLLWGGVGKIKTEGSSNVLIPCMTLNGQVRNKT